MTTATAPHPTVDTPAAPSRPRLVSRALLLVLVADFGALMSFYLLISVVPMYTASMGSAGGDAGTATAALMLSSLITELAAPRLIARFGYRLVLAAGLLLLGAPALMLTATTSMTAIMVGCALRGLGFGIMVVAAGALVATVVPAERRGEGLGLYGAVVTLPGVIALPLGIWLAGHAGYPAAFVAAAVAALAGLAVLPGLPGRTPRSARSARPARPAQQPVGILAGLRTPAVLRPAIVFSATTMAGGIVVAFLPLAVDASGDLATLALLAQAATATLSRWLAGRHSDRHGSAALLVPGLVAATVGMLALVLIDSPVAVVLGMLIFGAGFGATQNATLAMMLDRVPPSGYGTANAVWNIAYDAPYGLGAAGFGALAAHTGYPAGFGLTAALMLTALAPARRARAQAARGKEVAVKI